MSTLGSKSERDILCTRCGTRRAPLNVIEHVCHLTTIRSTSVSRGGGEAGDLYEKKKNTA
jgi:hypothetical protein